ncbi:MULTISPECIES: hypothetical protein [unclassified Microbacterium]|uniref:hypothetical protein n=1 Tax=unclassified Microbacterium TaxID=2609290 RepID=UPI0030176159
MYNLIPFPTHTSTVPVPLHRDADDDRLEEPRSRVAFAPRPALRDPMEPGSLFRLHFGDGMNAQGQALATARQVFSERTAA